MGCFPRIFQAYVFAISRFVETNFQRNCRNQHFAILSNRQVAIKATSYEIKSLLVPECIERLNRLSAWNRVHVIWMPVQKGLADNIFTDEPEPCIAVDSHIIKELLRKDISGAGIL